jgi:hypothetical protein
LNRFVRVSHEKECEYVILGQARATPQEGAAVTLLARRVIDNPALEEMLPENKDANLYSMGATRFGDGTSLAVEADHLRVREYTLTAPRPSAANSGGCRSAIVAPMGSRPAFLPKGCS